MKLKKLKKPSDKRYRKFQRIGIRYILKHKKALLADDAGLGKTIQTIGVINNDTSINKVLVICPALVKINWRRELKAWLVRRLRKFIVSGLTSKVFKRIRDVKKFVVIINFDILRIYKDQIDEIKWDLMVVDECQYLRNPRAKRTQAVMGRCKTEKRKRWPAIKTKRKLFLSGTPVLNHPIELWPILKMLDRSDLGHSYVHYIHRYCNPQRRPWGMDYTGSSNLYELSHKLYDKFMIRRLKSMVLDELPPKTRQVLEIPSEAKHEDLVIKELKTYQNYHHFVKSGGSKNDRKVVFAELSALRKEIALLKVDHIVELIKTSMEYGSVVCFAHHHEVIKRIAKHFKCVVITGKTKMRQRQRYVDQFQKGGIELLIGQTRAAGLGITLTKSQHIIFAELDWTPAIMSQAEDRCHRIGQSGKLLVQHVVLQNSLDSTMIKMLIKKQRNICKIMGDPIDV